MTAAPAKTATAAVEITLIDLLYFTVHKANKIN